MFQELSSPTYQHMLINHVPIIGLAFAVLTLAAALVLRNYTARLIALGLIFLASGSMWAVNHTGHGAYEVMRAVVDDPGTDWMDAHMDHAEAAEPAFYALAALTLAACLLPLRWPRTALPLACGSLVLGLVCLGLSGWIAKAGGQIRHSELRHGPAPQRDS